MYTVTTFMLQNKTTEVFCLTESYMINVIFN